MLITPNRRKFLTGLVSLFAAPAIVRAASLMPISVPKLISPVALSLSEIVTITLQHRTRQLADNVMANNALLRRLQERDQWRFT